ncbi:MAG: hypothetical protein IJQ60_05480 [Prevotella sp.]|nr:hypothetical protein [Prevotella sp.]MBQ7426485.1 hypothetical protein [Prevotella sp.]MBR0263315.1 hypothetical protein [Prevotella sp.]
MGKESLDGRGTITLPYPTISAEYWEIRWAYQTGDEVGFDWRSASQRSMIRSAMAVDELPAHG